MNKLIVLVAVLAAGCDTVTNRYSEYRNANNGERANLTFPSAGRAVAVGAAIDLTVERRAEGTYDCATHDNFFDISTSGKGPGVICTFAGTVSPVEVLLGASCDPGSCKAALVGNVVRVTGLAAGTFPVTVTARLADGTVLIDSTPVTFAAADAIKLTCLKTSLCPGPHAILEGAAFSWFTTLTRADAELSGDPIVSVEPAGVIEVGSSAGEVTVRSIKPGTATVKLSYAGLVRTQVVRVAAISEVASGKVHRLSAAAQGFFVGNAYVGASTDIVGVEAPSRLEGSWVRLVPVWVLRDGNYALGGAARLSPSAGKAILYDAENLNQAVRPNDVNAMTFMVGDISGCTTGRIQVTAKLGAATLDFTYDQICP